MISIIRGHCRRGVPKLTLLASTVGLVDGFQLSVLECRLLVPLSHAWDEDATIIRELTTMVRGHLVPPMQFVKVEGDAVFCYADGGVFRDRNGEHFIELIEVCYFDFSNRLLNMARNTTCPCSPCCGVEVLVRPHRAPALDLSPLQ